LLDDIRTCIKEKLHTEGFQATLVYGFRWLFSRPKLLIYEPVKKLTPRSPAASFDQAAVTPRIAVQIHVYYPALIDEILFYINQIPYRFDCYLSTDSEEKAAILRKEFISRCQAQTVNVFVAENRGRDVMPLLVQMKPYLDRYDYLLHLHSKYSAHKRYGRQWRNLLYASLLQNGGYIAALLHQLEQEPQLGLVFQRTYWRIKPSLGWKGNYKQSQALMRRLGFSGKLPRSPGFPAGNMFWARTKAVLPMFQAGLAPVDFPEESGQKDGTLAHCVRWRRCQLT